MYLKHNTVRPVNLTDAELQAFLDDQLQLELDEVIDE